MNWFRNALFCLLLAALAAPLRAATPPAWVVHDAKTGGKLTLVGSVHVCTASCLQFRPALMQALADSQALAVEIDTTRNEVVEKFVRGMSLPAPKTVWADMSAAQQARLRGAIERSGLAPEQVERLRLPFVLITLSMRDLARYGYTVEHSVDAWFIAQARKRSKPVRELETAPEQIEALLAGSEADRARAFERVTQRIGMPDGQREVEVLFESWQRGDIAGVWSVVGSELESTPTMYDAILRRRNQHMTTQLKGWLARGEQVFVVVGAGHLAGPDSLLTMLAALGYPAQPLAQ